MLFDEKSVSPHQLKKLLIGPRWVHDVTLTFLSSRLSLQFWETSLNWFLAQHIHELKAELLKLLR